MTVDAQLAREAVRRCVLFRLADETTIDAVVGELRKRRFRRGETIFHQGDPGDAFHVVASGSVKIVLPSPTGREGAILVTLRRGEFFGELALLDGSHRTASVVALEPTETLVLHRTHLDRLIDADPGFRRSLLASLAGEIRRITGHVEALHFLDLAGRLARRIVDLAEQARPGARSDVRLDWPYTQSDLAGMIGGSRESVNRLLAGLVADGVIRLERDALVIPDVDRLAAEVGR